MKRVILLLGLMFMFLPLVSSEVYQISIFPHENRTADIKQPCYNNDFYCSGAAECLVTVTNPAGNLTISNGTMTNQISYHNYTLNETTITTSGVYDYCITCRDGAFNASGCFEFTVNPAGIDFSESRTDAISRSIWVMFAIGLLLIASSFFARTTPIKWSAITLGAIFVLVTINLVFVGLQEEVVNPRIETLFDFITAASFYLYWFGFGILLVVWMLTIFNSIAVSKNQKRIARFEPGV